MKRTFIALIALIAFASIPLPAQEYGINFNRKSFHVTTNVTNTPVATTARLYTLIVSCTNAGSAWVITVQDKQGTPLKLYSATLATGTTTIALPIGVQLTSGIDIITSGTTPGVVDVWVAYR